METEMELGTCSQFNRGKYRKYGCPETVFMKEILITHKACYITI